MIAGGVVSTMAYARLITVYTVPSFSTFCNIKKIYTFIEKGGLPKGHIAIKMIYITYVPSMHIILLLVLQCIPVHPGLHVKHAPLSMRQVSSLQLVGQGVSQLLP